MSETIIVVGHTELDEYGNLIVTPKGGGDAIRINKKHENLHPLFEQGRAIKLDWQTYKGKTYVADAVLVEGELPPPVTPELPAEQQAIVDEALAQSIPTIPIKEPAPQAVGMTVKEVGAMIISKDINWIFGKKIALKLVEWYRGQILGVTRVEFDGKDLPRFE